MKYKVIQKSALKTIKWSGGTSTELFIYPENADFKKGDFCFRLSTATVEVDESVFTSLPNTRRTLMVLNGVLELEHEDQHNATLNKFEQDTFNGGWNTKSFGQCVDLNLMTKSNCKGTLSAIFIENEEKQFNDLREHTIVYAYSNDIVLKLENQNITLEEGNVCIVENVNTLCVTSNTKSEFIICTVQTSE